MKIREHQRIKLKTKILLKSKILGSNWTKLKKLQLETKSMVKIKSENLSKSIYLTILSQVP